MKKIRSFIILVAFFFFVGFCHDIQAEIIPRKNNITKRRACKVAIAAIFQNEAPFLKEWIEFHKLIGVEHFYLYNNLSTDNFEEILKPYVDVGLVELFDVPVNLSNGPVYLQWQVATYNHALNLSRNMNKWVAFIDIDEFICIPGSKDGKLSKKDNLLYSFLNKYNYAGGLAINWVMYGTSWVYDIKPGELLIDKLTMRYPLSWGENTLVKSIVRPELVQNCIDAHTFKYIKGSYAYHPNHQRFSHTPLFGTAVPVDKIRLNHYWYRTEKFFWEVKVPRRRIWGDGRSDELYRDWLVVANSEQDNSMKKFVLPLKKIMFR